MEKTKGFKKAFCAAFPHTVPVMTGYLFLGISYGIYMKVSGFSFLYPMLMGITIFGGSLYSEITLNLRAAKVAIN